MTPTRRTFLQQTAISATALSLTTVRPARADNDRITVAVIGCGGMGFGHARALAERKDVRVAYVCDPDEKRAADAAKVTGGQAVKDLRRVLEDKAVQAVWIATPDHWHAPAAILAANAGKHVYVEKPCSHNVREGRLMLEAARRNKVAMQVGTQSRSAAHVIEAIKLLGEGIIGDIRIAKAINSQKRANIGHGQNADPPAGLDYDLWLGPAPHTPYRTNLLHYHWHWYYNFGTGDMGNDGVHDIDIARWGLGVQSHPTFVTGYGSKLYFDDDQQFPDTQYICFEYAPPKKGLNPFSAGKKLLIYEQRIWTPYHQEGFENGNAFYGTEGVMLLSKNTGWKVFKDNKLVRESTGSVGTGPHHDNFLECVRSTGTTPNADIEIGHLSATLVHLGNIVARTTRALHFDPATERITGDAEADALTTRDYRPNHWAVPS